MSRALTAIGFVVALILSSCVKSNSETQSSKDSVIRDAVPPNLVVILAERPDPKSNTLRLQDYHREGGPFIPIFRSKESFQRSTGGGIDKPTFQIDRRLFVSMLRGSETIILDPSLPDQIEASANDLKRIFPEPFDVSHTQ